MKDFNKKELKDIISLSSIPANTKVTALYGHIEFKSNHPSIVLCGDEDTFVNLEIEGIDSADIIDFGTSNIGDEANMFIELSNDTSFELNSLKGIQFFFKYYDTTDRALSLLDDEAKYTFLDN